jgi:RimJ/RimL family protein N-acetyltransferase
MRWKSGEERPRGFFLSPPRQEESSIRNQRLQRMKVMILETERLRLRPWRDDDAGAFAALNADPEVMADLGGPMSRADSDAKLARYAAAFRDHQITRWAVETKDGEFIGYAGVMPAREDHPLGPHYEIGWRFHTAAWGHGYATEAAAAALRDAFERVGLEEVFSYTSADNFRSQAVMGRLFLARTPERDFIAEYPGVGTWRGLVWVARAAGR